ncbi:SipW-cognate class signal peptide [Nakamurella panacisegetis]|uniref:SipW-cognate class signal peptide n=1 Tax=Nakamurella panacisegetis TaxID=1090615 RepID=A0A1H0S5Z0_9ACTN|nr:SipW-dependent-type signal peptide-containing protein [Nakamurella panacisegetis]SDP36646.1 SipW-cognate class signal peptide [Nakamurella panacisegetis]
MAQHLRIARGHRWRLIRALLAGGLVLGIGTATTLASWTDNEYVSGAFTTSSFDIQSSLDGSVWADHGTSGAAASMTFNGSGMSPTAVRYAPLYVRTKPGSVSGTLALQGGTSNNTALAAGLQYRVVTFTGTCAAASFTGTPTFVVGSSSASATIGTAGSTTPVTANGASNSQLCFEVSMLASADNTLQGQAITIIWQLIATSS